MPFAAQGEGAKTMCIGKRGEGGGPRPSGKQEAESFLRSAAAARSDFPDARRVRLVACKWQISAFFVPFRWLLRA